MDSQGVPNAGELPTGVSQPNEGSQFTSSRARTVLSISFLALLVGSAFLYHARNQAILRDAAERLALIANFKADQIACWRAERLCDAAVMAENPNLRQILSTFAANPKEANAEDVRNHLKRLQAHNYFSNLLVVDLEGRMLLNLSGPGERSYSGSLANAVHARKPILAELPTALAGQAPEISVIAPIYADDNPDSQPICGVVLVCNAASYPPIDSWPTPSKTTETALFRREGQEVFALQKSGTAVYNALPLSHAKFPGALAFDGVQRFYKGQDERGVDVAAVGVPVPDSAWFLVVKEDSTEVFSEWRSRIVRMAVLLAALACGLGVIALSALQRYLRSHRHQLNRAEAGRRASEEKWRSVVATSPDGISIHSMEGVIEEVSERMVEMFGYEGADELIGKPLHALLESACHENAAELLRAMRQGSVTGPGEFLAVKKEGSRFNIEINAEVLRNPGGQPAKLIFITRDISERKKTEEANQRLMVAIDQSAESIVFTDLEGKILYVNQGFETASGYTRAEALGQNPRLLKSGKHTEPFYKKLWDTISNGKTWQGHFENRRKDGSLLEEDATISPIHNASGEITSFVAVKRDVTRLVQLERQLFESQKMEAIGRLAGGVAHDYNNILAANLMGLEVLLDEPSIAPNVRELLEDMKKGEQRAANLTRQLLMFGRRQPMQLRTVDLDALIEEDLKMLRRLLGERIDLTFQGLTGPAWIEADTGMIEQVVMNLCINARDAMPKGGRLTVGVKLVEIDSQRASNNLDARPGKYACLSVADVGCGMSTEIQQQIFEPFFTTKEVGKGTGLGLATVYGIVKQHNGWIALSSTLGKGTEFQVFLPAVEAQPKTAPIGAPAGVAGGKETILVVEDEDPVRKTVVMCLKLRGYNVLEACDGPEALRLWSDQVAQIDLLLTDMIMPGEITGLDLIDAFLKLKPALPAIIMSGYSSEISLSGVPFRPGFSYLPKPCDASELSNAVRKGLDGAKRL